MKVIRFWTKNFKKRLENLTRQTNLRATQHRKNELFLDFAAPKFGSYRKSSYLCTQNNGRVPFIGIGVSPIGRVVRFVATLFFILCLFGWIDFESQKLAVFHEYVRSQYVIGQIDGLWIQNVAS